MSGLKDKPRWVKKMKVFFHLAMDVNKKGYMTKDDWLAVVDRIADKNGYDVQSEPKAIALLTIGSQFYDELSLGKERLTEEEFVQRASEYLAQQYALKMEKKNTTSEVLFDTVFKALDMNNDGYLQPREWKVIFYMWNLPDFETKAVEAFKAADTNKDGKISPEEYQQFMFEFWLTDEDKFGIQGMFGPSFQQ